MSKPIKWIALFTVAVFSVVTIVCIDFQKNEISQLRKNYQQLSEENQVLIAAQKELNQQLKKKLMAQDSLQTTDDLQKRKKIGKDLVKVLNNIQSMLSEMNKRIGTLESGVVENHVESDRAEEFENITNSITPQFSTEQRIINSNAKQEAITQHFYNIEQTILENLDPQFTQQVQYSYEDMISSREDWTRDSSIKSSECGANYCKVVLNYKNSMDPLAQFEFDAMAYAWVSDLPKSRSQYRKNLDGTTDMIIYSARKGNELPAF